MQYNALLFFSFQRFLGTYLEQYFTEEEVHGYIEKLKHRLEAISEEIKQRNMSLRVPYVYMDPKNIPNSITI